MRTTQILFTAILAVGILSLTARALSARHVYLRGGHTFRRAEEPRRYWLAVGFFGLFGAAALVFAIVAFFNR